MKKKKRLDVLLVEHNMAASREKAKRLIMAGVVYVDNQRVDKAGSEVLIESDIEIRGSDCPFVSRGGLKLQKAIDLWEIDLNQSICLDIGASTGGFTDCMLSHGAKKVYAVDVGYGQLDWKLRQDSRVVNKERTNIRYLTTEQLDDDIDFISIDVSFISLKLVLPIAYKCMKNGANIVFLVKPQFEVGKEEASRNKGVIKSPSSHKAVLQQILEFSMGAGFIIKGLTFSPIQGAAGNIEFLAYAQKIDDVADMVKSSFDVEGNINSVIEMAQANFNGD